MKTVPACLSCGTCCFSHLEAYVRVTGADYLRLGDRAEMWVNFDGHDAYMRMVEGHCLALTLNLEKQAFFCDAYELRPQTCRDLGRNSPACLGEREMKRERPPIALRLSLQHR
jgi:uncharacterized protein